MATEAPAGILLALPQSGTASSVRARWAARLIPWSQTRARLRFAQPSRDLLPRRVPTVLAPALPALILLAVTTAGTVDPPAAGLDTQLRLTHAVTSQVSYPVVAR